MARFMKRETVCRADRRVGPAPIPLVLAALLAVGVHTASAQQTACRNTPATDERIECTEDATSTSDIDIDASGVDIDTSGSLEPGIYGFHQGTGNIDIDVSADVSGEQPVRSTIDTNSTGVYGYHQGTGNVDITVQSTDITTTGTISYGIHAHTDMDNVGDITITATDNTITTSGTHSRGIYAQNEGPGNITITATDNTITTTDNTMSFSDGIVGYNAISYDETTNPIDVQGGNMMTIDVQGGSIMTAARQSHGVYGWLQNAGDIDIDVRGAAVTTAGANSYGIYGKHQGHRNTGNISIDVRGGSITTAARDSYGVYGLHLGAGDIDIDVHNLTITTESTEVSERGLTSTHGIVGYHSNQDGGNTGDIFIDAHAGADITTKGAFSYGLYGLHQGAGNNIHIATDADSSITTTGASGHGIVAYHFGTEDTRSIDITVGGDITAGGTNAQGVRVGAVSSGQAARAAAFNEDGYRRQTVTVNGSVTSNAEGVFLAGGGRVVIGPQGSITSASGIAILATGDTPGADPQNDPPIPPKLRVDMNLDGRRVSQAIGDDWIINDGGETTIAVNGVVLHDGEMGVTGRRALNGAWNVRMRAEGVTVTDRSDPDLANWVISERSTDVVADRDFSAQDFNERRKPPPPPPPPPPMCPEGQIGTPPHCTIPPPPRCPDGQVGIPPHCTEPEPEQPMFMEDYAPRAAVYEALPDFLLRLTGPGPTRTCRSAPDEPVWVRFAGGQGSYEADRSTTGATYNLERFETEGGLSATVNDTTKGWVSVRHVWGAAGIGSPTGGGQLDVRGLGSSVGGAWQSPTGAYAMGCFSYMTYTVDFASRQAGLLKAGTNGRAATLDFEAGRRFALTEQVQLTPRVWVVGSRVTVASFTDAVDARVSFPDADRVLGGFGFVADTTRAWGEGEFTLRGSVDVERLLSGVETRVQVSGERLSAEATENSLLVGLHGGYRHGRFSVGAEVAARQEVGSSDSEYASFLNLGMQF